MKHYLFIYGTLLRQSNNELSNFLKSHSTLVSEGTVKGKLFIIDWYPGLILSPKSDQKVKGQIVELDENFEIVLKKIDQYEGVSNPPQPNDEYFRKVISVETDHASIDCWTYCYQGDTNGLEEIISGDFLSFIDSRIL